MWELGVRPNVVVGVFGAVVFLLTGSIIVQNWRDLTDTQDFEVDVDSRTAPLGQRSATMGSGSTRVETYRVPHENVTSVALRVTWQESSITGAQHDVTATLRNAQGAVVGQATGRGGVAGITIDREIAPTPPGGRFTTRSGNAQDEFESEYPPRPETVGDWTATIQTNAPTQPGASGVTYSLSFQVSHYVASYRAVPPLQR